jgi:hypothetical protein
MAGALSLLVAKMRRWLPGRYLAVRSQSLRLQREISVIGRPVRHRLCGRCIEHGAVYMTDQAIFDAHGVGEMVAPALVAGQAQEHHGHHDYLLLDIHYLRASCSNLRQTEIANSAAVAFAFKADGAGSQFTTEGGEAVLAP